jgi:5-oxoprolinase (ATP-hydrolysing) subunit A
MVLIDLNCDMGEGQSVEAQLVPYITSASIACGGHCGDAASIEQAIRLCQQHGVAVGAHPSYPDTANFGRKSMAMPIPDLLASLAAQINLFKTIGEAQGVPMHHIKPHGALYNDMANDAALSRAFAQWLQQHYPQTVVYMLSGSLCCAILQQHVITVAQEVFADRTYTDAGTLTPRSQPNALHTHQADAVAQVLTLVQQQRVCSTNGLWLPLKADTVCLHSDTPHALPMAASIHQALIERGIILKPLQA